MKIKLQYLHVYKSRGREFAYFRIGKASFRLPGEIGSREFMEAYEGRLKAVQSKAPLLQQATPGSVDALITEWRKSARWQALSPKSQKNYLTYLARISALWGGMPARHTLTSRVVRTWHDSLADHPASANQAIATLRALLSFGVERGFVDKNTALGVPKLKTGTWEPWTPEQITAMRKTPHEALRRALLLALYTGQRLSDILAMRAEDITGTSIRVTQKKTGKGLLIPLHRELKEALRDLPPGPIVRQKNGKSWEQRAFSRLWKNETDHLVGKDAVVFHGLRKNATINLIEAGCTEREVASITGMSMQIISHYALRVNQTKLAEEAIRKLESG
jgi:integrase